MNFKQLNFSQKIFSLVIIVFTITNGINAAAQALAQSSNSSSSGSFGGWLKSWFVSAPTEQQKKIATIVGERATERQKKLADVLYDATLLPEDLIKIIVTYDDKIFSGHTRAITALVALSHGKLASASKDKNIKIWDIERDRCVHTLVGHAEEVTALAALEKNQLASGAKNIKIWDIESGQCKLTFNSGQSATSVITSLAALSRHRLASATGSVYKNEEGNIKIWNTISGNQIQLINLQLQRNPWYCQSETSATYSSLTTLPNGNLAAAIEVGIDDPSERTGWNEHHFLVIDPDIGQILHQREKAHQYKITCLISLPNDKIASGSQDQHIKIWNAQTGAEIASYSPYNLLRRMTIGSPISLALHRPNQIASGWGDKKIRIIDLNTMQCIHTLEGHTSAVTAVATLPSNQLASGSEDGTIRVWNLEQEEHKE